METRQLQDSRHIKTSDQDHTNQGGKRMHSVMTRPLAVAAMLVGLVTGTSHGAQAAPISAGAEIPEVVNCSLFGEFYDETGRQLQTLSSRSWEAQLCAGAEATSAQHHTELEGSAEAVGLNCTMVARFYDERGVLNPSVQITSWEALPCAAMQSSKYLTSLGR